jgi:hypothetical protein
MRDYAENIAIFTIMVFIYAIAQHLILRSTALKNLQSKQSRLTLTHKLVSIVQYALIAILAYIILQMVFTLSYSITLMKVVVWINYVISVILLGFLAQRFFSWFKSNHNILIIVYAIAMLVLSLSVVFTVLYVSNELTGQRGLERITPLQSPVSKVVLSNLALNSAYLITSILSFIITWFATVLLLRQNSRKLGRAKYWIMVSIPLAYFLSQFQYTFPNAFTYFRISDPILSGVVYTMFFSATKPVGGFLFGLAFWTLARSTNNQAVKDYMITSAYGLILIFSSNQPLGLTLAPFPPFGLATISFSGIGCYLVLVGIYSSALSVANDIELRKSIRKSVMQKSNLLDSIGTAQMEQEIENNVMHLAKEHEQTLEEETGVQPSMTEQEIKDYLHTAIEEVKQHRNKPETT